MVHILTLVVLLLFVQNAGTLFVVTKQEHLLTITWSGQIVSDVPLSGVPFIEDCSFSSSSSSSPSGHHQPSLSSPFTTPTKQRPTSSSSSSAFVSPHYTRSSYTNLLLASSTPTSPSPSTPTQPQPQPSTPTAPAAAAPSSSAATEADGRPHEPVVRHIVYSEAIGVLGIVFTDGRAALVSTEKQQGEGSKQVMRGHWLPAAEQGQVLQGKCHVSLPKRCLVL
jgi:hypothetical protein